MMGGEGVQNSCIPKWPIFFSALEILIFLATIQRHLEMLLKNVVVGPKWTVQTSCTQCQKMVCTQKFNYLRYMGLECEEGRLRESLDKCSHTCPPPQKCDPAFN